MSVIAHYVDIVFRYIQMIRITDIIDIAIIAYIFFHLLLLTRKSQAGQVIKGIVLVLLALAVAYYCRLHVLYYILRSTVEIGILALIVVFQPEIRHFLEQVGSKGFGRLIAPKIKTSSVEHAIVQTVEAFGSMSEDHVGALVVFERITILDDCVKSGVEMDAAVSSALIKNIFWPYTPLHDGAVIIRNGRILSASCMLPTISNKKNIGQELGTRHRAGIELSKNSDAVVAIVSEETGAISVAVGGMLKRQLSIQTLETLLRDELIPAEDKRRTSLGSLLHRKKGNKGHVE